jgi:hypothetical protein
MRAAFDPKAFLAKMGDGKTISTYQKDQIVFSQGDVADAVFYIQSGKIKLTVVSEHGKEAIVGVLGPSHFCGEGCLNGHPLRVTTAKAIEPSEVTRIAKAAMIAALHDHPRNFLNCSWGGFIEPEQSNRRGSNRPIIQFQRETVGAGPSAFGEFRRRSNH